MYKVLLVVPGDQLAAAVQAREAAVEILGSVKLTVVSQLEPFVDNRIPDAIISVANCEYDKLAALPYWVRRRWVNSPTVPSVPNIIEATKHVYWGYTDPKQDKIPKVSIFTPTHNSQKFIAETWQAVRDQTYGNFEWVIVDDGSTDDTVKILKEFRAADPRIKLFEFPAVNRIGYLKKAATGLCTGSILVELDHDDWLTPNCLQRVVDEFATDPKIGMVYSNSAEYYPATGLCNRYDASYWRYRKTRWRNVIVDEALSWDVNGTYTDGTYTWNVIDAMNVCPNHVRAFRARALSDIGGYRDLVWADDYDVMIRMFLRHEIKLIPELLYVQRMGTNTWTKNTDLLWPCFGEVHKQYATELALRIQEKQRASQ